MAQSMSEINIKLFAEAFLQGKSNPTYGDIEDVADKILIIQAQLLPRIERFIKLHHL